MKTSKPKYIAIAAMSLNRVIGKDNTLPWKYPEDLAFFKRTTMGNPIVMGRKTYESIGRPLPGRTNYVLSTTLNKSDKYHVINNLSDIKNEDTVFIIGGEQVYKNTLPEWDELYLTVVKHEFVGDTFMPNFDSFFQKYDIIEENENLEFRHYKK